MTSSAPGSWKRAATRCVVPVHDVPRIHPSQEEDQRDDSGEEEEDEDEEFEDDGSMPSVDDLDGA